MRELLKIEKMNISFKNDEGGTISAVRDLNFHINEGETVGLVGESGCGKSVTALSLMKLIPENIKCHRRRNNT